MNISTHKYSVQVLFSTFLFWSVCLFVCLTLSLSPSFILMFCFSHNGLDFVVWSDSSLLPFVFIQTHRKWIWKRGKTVLYSKSNISTIFVRFGFEDWYLLSRALLFDLLSDMNLSNLILTRQESHTNQTNVSGSPQKLANIAQTR